MSLEKMTLLREGDEMLKSSIKKEREPLRQTERMAEVFIENIDLIISKIESNDISEIEEYLKSILLKNLNALLFDKKLNKHEYDILKLKYVNFSLKRYGEIDSVVLKDAIREMIQRVIYEEDNNFVKQEGKELEKYTDPIKEYLGETGYMTEEDLNNIGVRLDTVMVQKMKFFVDSKILRIIFSLPGYLEPQVLGYYDPIAHLIVMPVIGKVSDKLYEPKKASYIENEHEHYDAIGIFQKLRNFETTIHELLHAASCRNFIKSPEDDLINRRQGLRTHNTRDDSYRLSQLDEAVIEQLTVEIIISNLKKSLKESDLEKLQKARFFVGSYTDYRKHLKDLLKDVDFSYFVNAVFNERDLMSLERELRSKTGKGLSEINEEMAKGS